MSSASSSPEPAPWRPSSVPLAWLSAPVGGGIERSLLVLLFAALVAVRVPNILLHGRFWAEEGPIFFVNAWNLPWWQALLAPYGGYLQFIANLAGVLARYLAPLDAAPYVSSGLALIVQCVPAILLVSSRADWLQPRAVMLAALGLIAAVPFAQETWINSLNSQYHLTLSVCIILALDARTGRALAFDAFVLLLAALCSPQSWFLGPLLVLRALFERSGPRLVHCLVFFLGIAIQLAFFFSILADRKIGVSLTLLGAILFGKMLVMPLSGNAGAMRLYLWFGQSVAETGAPLWPLILLAVASAGALLVAVRYPRRPPLWFLLAGMVVAVCSVATAWGGRAAMVFPAFGGRYVFAAQASVALAVLSWSAIERSRARFLAAALVAWMLLVDARDFFVTLPEFTAGPDWRTEVVAWQRDPGHPLRTWPTGWVMTLPAK